MKKKKPLQQDTNLLKNDSTLRLSQIQANVIYTTPCSRYINDISQIRSSQRASSSHLEYVTATSASHQAHLSQHKDYNFFSSLKIKLR